MIINGNVQNRKNYFEHLCINGGLIISSVTFVGEYIKYYRYKYIIKHSYRHGTPDYICSQVMWILNPILSRFDGLEFLNLQAIDDSSVSFELKISKDYFAGLKNKVEKQKQQTVIKKEIESLDGVGFEDYLYDIFSSNGIEVEKTPESYDQGADLLVKYQGKTIAIQCKKYSSVVGNFAVQEVYASKAYYEADGCMVITNSYFSNSAIELAERCNVILVGGNDFDELFKKPKAFLIKAINNYGES